MGTFLTTGHQSPAHQAPMRFSAALHGPLFSLYKHTFHVFTNGIDAGLHRHPRRILWLRSASDGASLLRTDKLVTFEAKISVNALFLATWLCFGDFSFTVMLACWVVGFLVILIFFSTWKKSCVFFCWRLNQCGSCPGILDQNFMSFFMTSHTF